jgi:hypothetical protein
MSEQLTVAKAKVKHALNIGFRPTLTIGLVAILFEELLPEPLAKPIVITTVLGNIGVHLWSWRRFRQWIHK